MVEEKMGGSQGRRDRRGIKGKGKVSEREENGGGRDIERGWEDYNAKRKI